LRCDGTARPSTAPFFFAQDAGSRRRKQTLICQSTWTDRHCDQHRHRAHERLEWALVIALSIIWGGSFLFVGIAVSALPTFTIVLLRVTIAAAVLHLVLRALRIPLPSDAATWSAFFGMGLLNNVIPFSLIAWGMTHITSGLASILNATTPLFTVLLAPRPHAR
jgi:hypothetical protein